MNPLNRFRRRRSSGSGSHPQAHLTFASSSAGRSMTQAGLFLKKRLWVWPIIAVVVLSVVGFLVRGAIESTMKTNLASELRTLLDVEAAMLENWFQAHSSIAESLANDARTRELVYKLIDDDESTSTEAQRPQDKTVDQQLQKQLAPAISSHDYVGYFVTDKSKHILAATHSALVEQSNVPEYDGFLNRVLEGETIVSPPFPSVVRMKTEAGKERSDQPTMFVCAPVRDESFQVVGTLALQIRPEREFTRILQLGRLGKSGETYAFDEHGMMVSNSRFDEDLILLGLLPDQDDSRSILNVQIRDPQGNVTKGFRPRVRRAEMPLTRMASDAIAQNSNVDVEGYRDYRGVPVVGAWTWMPDYQIGVATEVDLAEAFRPLTILERTFWSLYVLLILSSVAIFVFTLVVARLQREAQKAAVEAKQLGQYSLGKKLGAGQMGVVYKGHHSMMRRETAIKMLNLDNLNETSIKRFEREVQITCQLTHPNTIAIYDYGRTPEGVFYYAMEYLDGIDLQRLVDEYGPQSEQRVIHTLKQVCGSLFEAHSNGLVHRDVKPANIMLNRRGCEPDVIKVLDFGLVKTIDEQPQANSTAAGSLSGTPLYMSPEAIQSPMSVDARSDIYAVGAVGYFLLTGSPVFDATSLVDLCRKHVDETPLPPSERFATELASDLEDVLLACLEKSRAKRPQTARDLAHLLDKCQASAGIWSTEDGDAWWGRHERGRKGSPPSTETNTTGIEMDQTIDLNRPG